MINRQTLKLVLLLLWSSGVLLAAMAATQQPKPAGLDQAALIQQAAIPLRPVAATQPGQMVHTASVPGDQPPTVRLKRNAPNLFDPPESTTTSQAPVTGWRDICQPYRMEITGTGMGDETAAINPQTLTLPHSNEVNWLLAQVAGRKLQGATTPGSVTFTTPMQTIPLNEPTSDSLHGYTFETNLQPTGQVTVSVSQPAGDPPTPRGLVLYSQRATTATWTSVGTTTNGFVWGKGGYYSYTEVLTFPELGRTTDLYLTAVVIDNNEDTRPLVLEAMAGDVTRTVTITEPTNGKLLDIIDLTLPQVITGTDRVTVTLRSPPENGDSLLLVGLNVSYRCPSPEGADLAVTKTVNNPHPNADDTIIYTVTVTNNGPDKATGVQLSDKLSADLTYITHTLSHGSYDHINGVWDLEDDLAKGEKATLTITARVNNCTNGMIIPNIAKILTADQPDPNSDNNDASVDIKVTSVTPCYTYLPTTFNKHCRPFIDSFDFTSSHWPEVDNARLKTEYIGSEYRMFTWDSDVQYAYNRNFADYFTDYDVEVDARWFSNTSTGEGYGVIFGLANDNSHAYLYQINTDRQQYRLLRYSNGSWWYYANGFWSRTTDTNKGWIYTNTINSNPTHYNHLKVTRKGSQIKLYVNNKHLDTAIDNVIPSGRVGLSILTYYNDPVYGTRNADVRFDNYEFNHCLGTSTVSVNVVSNSLILTTSFIGALPRPN